MSEYFKKMESLTFAGAEQIARLALAKAAQPIAIVVVDAYGDILLARTSDGAPPGLHDAALLKARGAARTGTATHLIAAYVQTLPPAIVQQALSLPNVCAFQGGVPVRGALGVAGGVGIAGGTGEQDIEIAIHASKIV
jgi:glc operon protein GlcG